MEQFAFSVKKVSGKPEDVTKADYENYIKSIVKLGCKLEHINYEFDKQGSRLHFHAILSLPKNFLRTRLRMANFNVDYKPLRDKRGWLAYIRKDQKTRICVDPREVSEAPFEVHKDEVVTEDYDDEFIVDLDKIKI
jgi:hypothetical protein